MKTSMKNEQTWNNTYQKPYKRAKSLIKKDAFTTFYNEKDQLYPEIAMLGVSLRASLLQVRDGMQFLKDEAPNNRQPQPIAFTSRSLTSVETWLSNIKGRS